MTIDPATLLDLYLRAAGIPILGVSIPTLADRSTWIITFDPSATPTQRTQAASLVQTFDPTDQTPATNAAASGAVAVPVVKALLATLLDQKLGRTLTTADGPALQALFTKTVGYYKFIVNNGL